MRPIYYFLLVCFFGTSLHAQQLSSSISIHTGNFDQVEPSPNINFFGFVPLERGLQNKSFQIGLTGNFPVKGAHLRTRFSSMQVLMIGDFEERVEEQNFLQVVNENKSITQKQVALGLGVSWWRMADRIGVNFGFETSYEFIGASIDSTYTSSFFQDDFGNQNSFENTNTIERVKGNQIGFSSILGAHFFLLKNLSFGAEYLPGLYIINEGDKIITRSRFDPNSPADEFETLGVGDSGFFFFKQRFLLHLGFWF